MHTQKQTYNNRKEEEEDDEEKNMHSILNPLMEMPVNDFDWVFFWICRRVQQP